MSKLPLVILAGFEDEDAEGRDDDLLAHLEDEDVIVRETIQAQLLPERTGRSRARETAAFDGARAADGGMCAGAERRRLERAVAHGPWDNRGSS